MVASIKIMGQAAFSFNEEWYSAENDLFTRMRRFEGIFFWEEETTMTQIFLEA